MTTAAIVYKHGQDGHLQLYNIGIFNSGVKFIMSESCAYPKKNKPLNEEKKYVFSNFVIHDITSIKLLFLFDKFVLFSCNSFHGKTLGFWPRLRITLSLKAVKMPPPPLPPLPFHTSTRLKANIILWRKTKHPLHQGTVISATGVVEMLIEVWVTVSVGKIQVKKKT